MKSSARNSLKRLASLNWSEWKKSLLSCSRIARFSVDCLASFIFLFLLGVVRRSGPHTQDPPDPLAHNTGERPGDRPEQSSISACVRPAQTPSAGQREEAPDERPVANVGDEGDERRLGAVVQHQEARRLARDPTEVRVGLSDRERSADLRTPG